MATLFDTIKNALAKPPAQAQPQQQQVQNVLRAKSGKAGGSGGPGASNLGESQALAVGGSLGRTQAVEGQMAASDLGVKAADQANKIQTAQAGLDAERRQAETNIATQGAAARTQMQARETATTEQRQAQEQLKIRQINAAADAKLKELASERRVASADIFASFEHSNKELEFRKDAAELEQLGFLMALRDQAYLDEINRIGQERGLQDEIAYKEEMSRLVMGNELHDLMSKLGFQSTYNTTQRDFEKQLAQIDINAALRLAEAAIRDANNRAVVEGATTLVASGADNAAKHFKDKK